MLVVLQTLRRYEKNHCCCVILNNILNNILHNETHNRAKHLNIRKADCFSFLMYYPCIICLCTISCFFLFFTHTHTFFPIYMTSLWICFYFFIHFLFSCLFLSYHSLEQCPVSLASPALGLFQFCLFLRCLLFIIFVMVNSPNIC